MANKYALIHSIMYVATRNTASIQETEDNINKVVHGYARRHGLSVRETTILFNAIINYYF